MEKSICLNYLRSKKAAEIQSIYSSFDSKELLGVETYKNAVILPQRQEKLLHGIGGVISEDNEFIQLSGIEGQFGGIYNFDKSSVSYLDKKVCFCGFLVKQWGHFLLDATARLWYFLDNLDDAIDEYVFIVEENSLRVPEGNYKEFLQLLGIFDRIRIINKPIRFKEVIIPERSFKLGDYYSRQFVRVFDQVALNAERKFKAEKEENKAEKVFLSRSHFQNNNIEIGLDFLDHYFAKNSFMIVHPEEISLSETIWLLRNAKICAAESGTLPHNFLFAQNKKSVIIVERQVTINEYQVDVDVAKELFVTYIDANYEIYTTAPNYGPYFIGYTECFKQFTEQKDYLPPDEYYSSEKYLTKCLKDYIRSCRREYGYAREYSPWQFVYRQAIFEAYNEAYMKFKPYLTEQKALFWYQRFLWHYIKKQLFLVKSSSNSILRIFK